jgi:hypothetical protein
LRVERADQSLPWHEVDGDNAGLAVGLEAASMPAYVTEMSELTFEV